MRSVFIASLLALAMQLVSASPVTHDNKNVASAASSFINYAEKIASGTCGQCDLSQVSPPPAPTPFPPPSAGLTLHHVAIGRGTQNYTCANDTTATPVAAGALASLFNITCLVANSPGLVSNLTTIALNAPEPYSPNVSDQATAYYGYSGIHYFLDLTTPYFNLNTANHQYGDGAFKKAGSCGAPADSTSGPNNSGNGAVAWLQLSAEAGYDEPSYSSGSSQVLKEVYRVETAGGSPPATCAGQAATFQVQYSALYYFYA